MQLRNLGSAVLLILIILFFPMAMLVARDLLTQVVIIILWAAAASVILLALSSAIYLIASLIERLRTLAVQRRQLQKDIDLTIITSNPGQTIWVRDMQPGVGYRNLSLDPRREINGTPPTEEEWRVWAYYQELQIKHPRVVGADQPALPAPGPLPDVIQAVRQYPACIVVGAMDSGKTTLLHHIAQDYRQRGAQVVVLDPHASPDKWPEARVVGTGRNFIAIENALTGLVGLMNRRYDEIGRGDVREGEHEPVVVIADEWMAINQQCHGADSLMVELLTESRKAALRFYVGSHSRRVKSLGVDRKGDLLDGVAFILLSKDSAGQRRAIIETYDGSHTQRAEAILPGEYRVLPSDGDADQELHEALTPQPTDEELHVLSLHAAGQSYREISQIVWGEGKFGRFYNEKIEAILRKWDGWQAQED